MITGQHRIVPLMYEGNFMQTKLVHCISYVLVETRFNTIKPMEFEVGVLDDTSYPEPVADIIVKQALTLLRLGIVVTENEFLFHATVDTDRTWDVEATSTTDKERLNKEIRNRALDKMNWMIHRDGYRTSDMTGVKVPQGAISFAKTMAYESVLTYKTNECIKNYNSNGRFHRLAAQLRTHKIAQLYLKICRSLCISAWPLQNKYWCVAVTAVEGYDGAPNILAPISMKELLEKATHKYKEHYAQVDGLDELSQYHSRFSNFLREQKG